MATSHRARIELQLAIVQERVRGLEATVALLQEALLAAASKPVVLAGGTNEPAGYGFARLAEQTLANADPEPAPPTPEPPKIFWFKADGTDPAIVPTLTPEA